MVLKINAKCAKIRVNNVYRAKSAKKGCLDVYYMRGYIMNIQLQKEIVEQKDGFHLKIKDIDYFLHYRTRRYEVLNVNTTTAEVKQLRRQGNTIRLRSGFHQKLIEVILITLEERRTLIYEILKPLTLELSQWTEKQGAKSLKEDLEDVYSMILEYLGSYYLRRI